MVKCIECASFSKDDKGEPTCSWGRFKEPADFLYGKEDLEHECGYDKPITIETHLRDALEEYYDKGKEGLSPEELEIYYNTESVNYVYEMHEMYNGGLNRNLKYEFIHVLRPEMPLIIEDSMHIDFEGFCRITRSMTKKYMYFSHREERDKDD